MHKKFKRIFTIVIDSCGVGSAPDAAKFDDVGANTIGHISEAVESFKIPNLQKIGMANLTPLKQVAPLAKPEAYYTKMIEASSSKDTMTGHWEMMGLRITEPFITFTETGFPDDLVAELEARTGHKFIGNKSASGTAIIDEYGERQLETKEMILYTSADSVLQIAANEEIFGIEEIWRTCEIAREITMKPEWKVGRIIARPFIGKKVGEFVRTSNRHDYALKPTGKTVLNALEEKGFDVISVGKIADIFVSEGITESNRSTSSVVGMEQTIELAKRDFEGLAFVNLVDFDAKWGHRRNPVGYAKELEDFDVKLGELMEIVNDDDLIIVTADHGTDPTWRGSDHTREMVPLLMYSKQFKDTKELNDCDTFSDLGATIADNFNVENPGYGKSLLKELV